MERVAHYGETDSPFGPLWIAMSGWGVAMVAYHTDELAFCHALDLAGFQPEYEPSRVDEASAQLHEFFAGTRTAFTLPIDHHGFSPFRRAVLEAVAGVPFGEVRSYADIAAAAGRPRAARGVGTTLAGNRVSFFIPCHRIIRSDGSIGEYGGTTGDRSGVEIKRWLLRREGINL